MDKTIIMGIQIHNRTEAACEVQKLLTEFGCIIKTRLGLHEAMNSCSSSGLILLEFIKGQEKEVNNLKSKLQSIVGLKVSTMEL